MEKATGTIIASVFHNTGRPITLSIEPLMTYRLNAFSMFFVGSTHAYQDAPHPNSRLTQSRRQFFAKFQYLFRN